MKVARGAKSRGGSAAPSTTSSGKRKRDVVEVVMPPTKRLRAAAAMTQEGFWAELIRLMEASERRAAESSRAASEREERLRAAITLVGTGVMQQNKILLRIEERLAEVSRRDEDDEDDGDEPIEVPILDAEAAEDVEESREMGAEDGAKGMEE